MPVDADVVANAVLAARRYRHVAPAMVWRIASDEARRATNIDDGVKRTKRKLHQVCGAYAAEFGSARAIAQLRHGAASGVDGLRRACLEVMRLHASTRERLPYVERFYQEIFAKTGTPLTVLDVACGLGPLAAPWMALPAGACYHAYDVDARLVETVDVFLTLYGLQHVASLGDAAAEPPADQVDVALALKTLPCIEQQSPGAARRLIEQLAARSIVVSYPTRSLGGVGGKGMVRNYRQQFEQIAEGVLRDVQELTFPGELVFVCRTATG